jgi:hypothetical protein
MVQMMRPLFVFLDSALIRAVLACTGRLRDGKRSSLQSLLVLHLQEHNAKPLVEDLVLT